MLRRPRQGLCQFDQPDVCQNELDRIVRAVEELIRRSCEFQSHCTDGLPHHGYSKSYQGADNNISPSFMSYGIHTFSRSPSARFAAMVKPAAMVAN
jgi:hypothetical protein